MIRIYKAGWYPHVRIVCDHCERRIDKGTKGVLTWELEPEDEDSQTQNASPPTGEMLHLCNRCIERFLAKHGGPERWRTPPIPLARLSALIDLGLYRHRLRNLYIDFPSTEEELIDLFQVFEGFLGWRIVHLQREFPDAIIEDDAGNREVVEFEYGAKSFERHHHDPEGCDRIVCWHNDWPDAPLPVWALNTHELFGELSMIVWKHTLAIKAQMYGALSAADNLRGQLAALKDDPTDSD